MAEIIKSADIATIAEARHKAGKWAELSDEDRAAYTRIHDRLADIAEEGRKAATPFGEFMYGLTSGFTTKSGIRSYIPKDLWFALFRKERPALAGQRGGNHFYGQRVIPRHDSQIYSKVACHVWGDQVPVDANGGVGRSDSNNGDGIGVNHHVP